MPPSGMIGGASLGIAHGSITIDTSDLTRFLALSQQVGQQATKSLNLVNQGAKTAQTGTQGLASAMGGLGRAVGIVGGVAGAIQLGRFALDADATATAYKRQSVAALSLAGSQSKLNELLSTYDKATGGAVDRAQALADVVKLQATGFADTTSELEKFTTAARGISVATGRDQDYVISQLQLAIANKSTMRLDQLGLGIGEVANKVKELKKQNSGLTEEQIYQNAVLGIALQKFGALAKSTVAQATGAEQAAKAWKDFRLEFGEAFGPAVSEAMSGAATQIKGISDLIKGAADDAKAAKKAFDEMRGPGAGVGGAVGAVLNFDPIKYIQDQFSPANVIRRQIAGAQNMRAGLQSGIESGNLTGPELARQKELLAQVNSQLGVFRAQLQLQYAGSTAGANNFAEGFGSRGAPKPFSFTDAQLTAVKDWSKGVQQIEHEASSARLEATKQFGAQYASAVHEYEQSIARESQDFGISRKRQAEDLADNIADIQKNSAKQAEKWAEDLSKSIAKATDDTNERIAKIQKDSNKRIAEIDADYRKNREKAARDHTDNLMEAAGNLDAKAVYQEQKRYAEQSKDAKEAHDDAIKKEKDGQAERIAEEQASLAKRIKQDQDANAERLADAAQADAERIQDAKDALAKQQAQEDEDRALRLQRMAEDQADQLAQMGAAQAERMAQIDAQEAEQKKAANDAFNEQLEAAGIHNNAWLKQQDIFEKESLKRAREFWRAQLDLIPKQQGPTSINDKPKFLPDNAITDPFAAFEPKALGGPITQTKPYLMHAGEYVVPAAAVNRAGGFAAMAGMQQGGRNVSVGDINIFPLPGQNANDIAQAVRSELHSIFEGN